MTSVATPRIINPVHQDADTAQRQPLQSCGFSILPQVQPAGLDPERMRGSLVLCRYAKRVIPAEQTCLKSLALPGQFEAINVCHALADYYFYRDGSTNKTTEYPYNPSMVARAHCIAHGQVRCWQHHDTIVLTPTAMVAPATAALRR